MAHAQIARQPGASARAGYAVAVAVNLLLIYAVHNFWDVVPFLTADFERLIWAMTASLAVGLVANLMYLAFDPAWFKSLTNIGVLGGSLAVTVRLYQVFPFAFSGFDWSPLVEVFLWVVMAGTSVAIVVEAVRVVLAAVRELNRPIGSNQTVRSDPGGAAVRVGDRVGESAGMVRPQNMDVPENPTVGDFAARPAQSFVPTAWGTRLSRRRRR